MQNFTGWWKHDFLLLIQTTCHYLVFNIVNFVHGLYVRCIKDASQIPGVEHFFYWAYITIESKPVTHFLVQALWDPNPVCHKHQTSMKHVKSFSVWHIIWFQLLVILGCLNRFLRLGLLSQVDEPEQIPSKQGILFSFTLPSFNIWHIQCA